MLIVDIKSYIRQLLPPSYRDAKTIGMISVLFRPLSHLINRYNEYRYRSQFDTGASGQVFVLQYLLREMIHPSIRIVDGNFGDIDFRVLVPPALTNEESALLYSLIERYRLHSRRYDVSVQANWGPGSAVGGLQWVDGYPRLNHVENGWVISYGIKQTGMYMLRIKNETTGSTVSSSNVAFIGGGVFQRFVNEPGIYSLRIGGLTATLIADNTGTICDLSYAQAPTVETLETSCKLAINLYSGRPNIGPFVTRIYNPSNGLLQEVAHSVFSGEIVIPRFPDGTYKVETLDRFGCQTTRENIYIGVPLAWNPGFPYVDENRIIWVSVNRDGLYNITIGLASGGAPEFDQVDYALLAFQEVGTAPVANNGVYNITVGPLSASVTVGGGVVCDLTWLDDSSPGTPSSLAFRIDSGQQQLKANLYSGRPGISPFFLEILQGASVVSARSYTGNNTWLDVGPLTAGIYQVRVTDKDGCRTTIRDIAVTEAGGSVPLIITNAAASISGGQYSLTVAFTGGAGNKTIQVVGTGGLITSVPGVSVSPRTIALPAGTPPQTVKVVVQDNTGSAEYNGVVLSPASTGAYAPVLWSEGNKKYIDIRITGSPGNWLISDVSGFSPPSGFQHYYYFGNKKIRQFGPLTNEPWQTNQPVQVMLCFIKPSAADINVWTFPLRYPGGWGDPNAGLMLDKADIGVYESYIFKKQ